MRYVMMALLGTMLLAGCAPPEQLQRMERDLAEMKRRLAEAEQGLVAVRKDLGGGTAQQAEVSALSKRQADLQADFEMFRGEFQGMSGQLDEIRAGEIRQKEELLTLQQEVSFKARNVEERLAKLEQAPVAPAPAPAAQPKPEDLYRQGLDAIRLRQDYAEGRKLLDRFAKENPKHELAVNARYWIGEAWYGEGKYENAILQFQDVIQDYGDQPKVASALLKQALAFQKLGDSTNTKVLLQRLIERFPESEDASRAKELLTTLK